MSTEKLRVFAALVEKWSARINLVSKADIPVLWERHVQDSLELVPFMPPGVARAVDLGSGAGFPGLVLALATGVEFTLIEADRRKAAFLMEAARVTGAPVHVVCARIEAAKVAPARLVTARALAPLERLVGLAALFLAEDGICLFPKGAGVEDELTGARALWHMEVERLRPPDGGLKCILKVSQVRHVGTDKAPPPDHRGCEPEGRGG